MSHRFYTEVIPHLTEIVDYMTPLLGRSEFRDMLWALGPKSLSNLEKMASKLNTKQKEEFVDGILSNAEEFEYLNEFLADLFDGQPGWIRRYVV